MKKELKSIFTRGPVSSQFIGEEIGRHAVKKEIGAHSLFLGQVRADEKEGQKVIAIEYSAYEPMVMEKLGPIRESIFQKYPLHCLHIYHSLGRVNAGEISLFVFASSRHRKPAIEACQEIVERIKFDLPIWGKEILEGEHSQWKINH